MRVGEFYTYTGNCVAGVAHFTVYAHSSQFEDPNDPNVGSAPWPDMCTPVEPWLEVTRHSLSYEYAIPCPMETLDCPVEAENCTDLVDKVLLDMDFEDGNVGNWRYNFEGNPIDSSNTAGFSKFLGLVCKEKTEVAMSLAVDPAADAVLVEFDFYEIDQWETADKLYFRLNRYYLNLGEFSVSCIKAS